MVTYQIISGLNDAHVFRGGQDYPEPFNYFVNVIDVFSLDAFTIFRTECMARTDYADKLMVSLLTLSVLGALALSYGAVFTRIYGGDILQSSSVKGFLLLIYIVLPTMSSLAFSAFNCDDVSARTFTQIHHLGPPAPPSGTNAHTCTNTST